MFVRGGARYRNDEEAVVASRGGPGTGRAPCKRVKWTKTVALTAKGTLHYWFCWNRRKHKVSLSTQDPYGVDVSRLVPLGATVGLANNILSPHPLSYRGHWRGALDGHGAYDIKAGANFPGGVLTVTFHTQHVNWGVVARYDGSTCAYQGNDRQRDQRCGVAGV